jgi:hypothetical protein
LAAAEGAHQINCGAMSRSGVASQRFAAVVGDHVSQRGGNVDLMVIWLKVGVSAEQVADESLRIGPFAVAAEVDFTGGLQRGESLG